MTWSGVFTGVLYLVWTQANWLAAAGRPLWLWSDLYQVTVAVVFGFLNAGLFGLLAGLRKWPAAHRGA
jgi:hypothetical protein